jgi:hypothetical protein
MNAAATVAKVGTRGVGLVAIQRAGMTIDLLEPVASNPFCAGNPYNPGSPTNPYGRGLRIEGR